MKISKYSPSLPLRPFIRSFLIIESEQGMVNRILPDSALVAAFRFKGSVSYRDYGGDTALSPSVITGIRTSARVVTYSRGAGVLLAIFRETGAAAFFSRPLHEIGGISVPLSDFFPGGALSRVEDELSGAKSDPGRIAVIEGFFLSGLVNQAPDPLVREAVRRILQAGGNIRMRELAKALCISLDPFEKKFRKITGASPKRFAGIVRFRNLIGNRSGGQSLTDLAYQAGYHDQSHFIRDFKSLAGQTPGDFFKSPAIW